MTTQNQIILSEPHKIYNGNNAYSKIRDLLEEKSYSSVFVLVDENTKKHCLPVFAEKLQVPGSLEIIEIKPGEEYKNLETCTGVWEKLSELGADRKTLLINLGGGIITDLGGFCASVFKRGINFIHVPTTLLSMTDAAIGGKTGVDFGSLKNQIGTFHQPELIAIAPAFLATLPERQLKNGLTEMFKHGLVYRESYWKKLSGLVDFSLKNIENYIPESIEIKSEIIAQDPKESGLRKILNFGHTLGHALESWFLSSRLSGTEKPTLLHGEAIAVGMILETYISSEMLGFSKQNLEEITQAILSVFPKIDLQESDYEEIISFLKHDKKNEKGEINFVLLEGIAKPKIDCKVEKELILRAFEYYSRI